MLIYKELLIDFKNLFEILNACFPTNFNNGSKKIKKNVEPIIETAIAFELLFFIHFSFIYVIMLPSGQSV